MLSIIFYTAINLSEALNPRIIYLKIKFIFLALFNRKLVIQFLNRLDAAGYSRIYKLKPSPLAAAVWPYIHNNWSLKTKLDKIALHYETIHSLPSIFSSITNTAVLVADLHSISHNCWIGIDHPIWFKNEGEIVLNLFQNDLRVVSIAFIFSKEEDSKQSMIIGAIQGIHRGINSDTSLAIFRNLTKDFAGLRPRSLLIEIVRMVAKITKTTAIIAVSDENRQHRHKYYGDQDNCNLLSNYNEIWLEHGGELLESGFYVIPVDPKRKDIEEIPSKKRSMYRHRADILEEIYKTLEKRILN